MWHYLYQILWRAGRDTCSISQVLLGAAPSAILLVRKAILPCLKEVCKALLTITAWFLLRVWHWIWPVHPVVGCSVAAVAAWCSLHVPKHQGNSTSEELLLILPAGVKLIKSLHLIPCANTWAPDSDLGYQHGWHLCVCCLSWICSQHGSATNLNVDGNFLDMIVKF